MLSVIVWAYLATTYIGSDILDLENYGDTWFDSDTAAYFQALLNRHDGLHSRTYKHPLLSLLLGLPFYSLKFLGINSLAAVKAIIASVAGLWIGTLFVVLRIIGCQRLDAVIFSLFGVTSASAMFYLILLESYPLGSLSILLALALVAFPDSYRPSRWVFILASAFTLSITVTNWLFGILATFLNFGRKQAIQITTGALGLVVVLAGLQKVFFPDASFPPFLISRKETRYIFSEESGNLLNILQSFVSHTIVMPAIRILPHPRTGEPLMLTQFSSPGSGSILGAIAVGLWMGLFALGIWALLTLKNHFKLRLFLGICIPSQLVLHIIYTGRETFVYALHFLPLFITLVALVSLTRLRHIGLFLAGLLLTCNLINNIQQFHEARNFYSSPASLQEQIMPSA
jgi:hypothetical protein